MIEAGWIEIEEAKHLPMNAKLHDLADLTLSFDDFGFVDRVIVNRTTGNLISGHGRLDALADMKKAQKAAPGNVKVEGGRWYAPVDWIECEAEREDALAVRLNLSQMKGGNVDLEAMLGSFDLEKLYQTAADAAAKGYLEATGLTDAAMKYLEKNTGGAGNEAEPEAQIDKAEELREKWQTATGQLWQVGKHRIICGDCMDRAVVERLMGGEKAICIFTDPPYGVDIGEKNRFLNSFQPAGRNLTDIESDNKGEAELYELLLPAFKLCHDLVMADNCSIFVCSPQGGSLGLMMMMMMKDAKLEIKHVLNWVKNAPTFSLGRLDYEYQHEPILFTWKKTHKRIKGGKFHTSIWQVDKPRANTEHPTIKPVELPENAIANHTDSGDVVYDGYLGSGTTLVACERLGRIGRGVEISPAYVAVALQRLADMGLEPVLLEAG